jgi:hypothetical protein
MELLDTILATQNQIGLPKQPTKTLWLLMDLQFIILVLFFVFNLDIIYKIIILNLRGIALTI